MVDFINIYSINIRKLTSQPTLRRSSRKRTNVEKRPIDEDNNSSKPAKK